MARIGSTPPANRYQGLHTSVGIELEYETQNNIPVDSSNANLRNFSPFIIRPRIPEVLQGVELLRSTTEETSIGSIINPDTGDTENIPKRDVNAFNTSSSVYGKNKTLSRRKNSAQRFQIGGSDQRVTEKIRSNVADLNTFILNGEVRNSNNSSYYSDVRFVDQMAAADIAAQAILLQNVPPLTLLINPNSMSISYQQVSQYSERTRFAYIYHAWGEEQPTLSFSGEIGGYMAASAGNAGPNNEETQTVSGLQFASKRDSASFQNLMSLFHLYENNGYIFDRLEGSYAHHLIGNLEIEYDNWLYIGHIQSFDYGYEEDQQNGKMSFDVSFQVSKMIDLHEGSFSVFPLRSPNDSNISPREGVSGSPFVDLTAEGTSLEPETENQSISSTDNITTSSLSNNIGTVNQSGASNEALPPSFGGFA